MPAPERSLWGGGHRHILIVLCLLAFARPATAAEELGEIGSTLGVTRVLWSGVVDGLDARHTDEGFRLAPDGRGFLFFQGAPWPRLMYRPIEDPGESVMVAPLVPLSGVAARFSRAGDAVYLTALDRTAPLPAARSGTRPLQACVFRVEFPGLAVTRIHPPRGAPDDAFSLLLDVHPSGETLLIGSGSGLTALVPRESVDLPLHLREIPSRGGAAVDLALEVGIGGLVRYSRDGAVIEYTTDSRGDVAAEVFAYDRRTASRRRTGARRGNLLRRAGDADLRSYLAPHRGSFGRDSFWTHEVRLASDRALARLPGELRGAPSAGAGEPPFPLAFRGRRGLLRLGPLERARLAVAEFETEPLPRPEAASSGVSSLLLDPDFLSDRILADHEPAAAGILDSLRASLRTEAAVAPAAIRAKYEQLDLNPQKGRGFPIEVIELSSGLLRVDHILDLSGSGEGEEPEEDPASSVRQVFGFDGTRCWMQGEDGDVRWIRASSFAMELNLFSVFRMLLDPAGLGDAGLRFGSPRAETEGDGETLWSLPFAYRDGYRGRLVVRKTEKACLPLSIRSPWFPESRELAPRRAGVEKWISFDEWETYEGWRIPREIRFVSRETSFRLVVRKIDFASDISPERFQSPVDEKNRSR